MTVSNIGIIKTNGNAPYVHYSIIYFNLHIVEERK